MFNWQKEVRDSMLLMVSKNRGYITASHNILKHVHNIYINQKAHLYDQSELFWINNNLESVIYKSFLVRIAIEQLQTIRHGRMNESLWEAIENSLCSLSCSEDEQVMLSFAFEAFLFEARSFLDVYMTFICFLLKTGWTKGHMSRSKFYQELDKTKFSFKEKAKWVKKYFDTKVFGEVDIDNEAIFRDDWGTLLKSLRDRIAHRDIIDLSFDSKEKFLNDILLDWPTIKEITYHQLAETVGNGIHALFYEVLCHVYELRWDDYQKIAQKVD